MRYSVPAARPNVSDSKVKTSLLLIPLLGIFFFSGYSSLIYEVAWTRTASLVFGVTIYAVSTVLASFMGGLALGSFLAGKFADRVSRPLMYYAAIELAIGAIGVFTLWALKGLTPIYAWLYEITDGSLALVTIVRFLAAGTILLFPTTLMGATLPFFIKASLTFIPRLGESVSLLYAYNTAGAAIGTLMAGFFLIGQFGLQGAVYVAVALNLAVAVVAVLMQLLLYDSHKQLSPLAATSNTFDRTQSSSITSKAVLMSFGISGFCALAYEVIWFRILEILLPGMVYAFSLMLFIFLLGLACGSLLVKGYIYRLRNSALAFAGLELAIGVVGILSLHLVGKLPALREGLLSLSLGVPFISFISAALAWVLTPILVLLPLTLLSGMTFPVAVQALEQRGGNRAGKFVGEMNAANTIGAIFGSLVAGFVLLPFLGSQSSITLIATINMAIAVFLWIIIMGKPAVKWALFVTVVSVLVAWSAPDLMNELLQNHFKGYQVIWYEEGIENTVSILKRPEGSNRLFSNSRLEAEDTSQDARSHQIVGHLGMLVHPDPKDVLVVGLGGGATAGAMSKYKESTVEIVELSQSILNVADFFSRVNNNVLQQDNVLVRVDDGRNHLLLTPSKYDVITADTIWPHYAGSGTLYSLQYFQLANEKLKEDGIMVQWAPTTQTSIYPLIARTFLKAFPFVTSWYGGNLLIGSKQPLDISSGALEKRLEHSEGAGAASDIGIHTVNDLLSQYAGDAPTIREKIGDGPVITDDHPRNEYFLSIAR